MVSVMWDDILSATPAMIPFSICSVRMYATEVRIVAVDWLSLGALAMVAKSTLASVSVAKALPGATHPVEMRWPLALSEFLTAPVTGCVVAQALSIGWDLVFGPEGAGHLGFIYYAKVF